MSDFSEAEYLLIQGDSLEPSIGPLRLPLKLLLSQNTAHQDAGSNTLRSPEDNSDDSLADLLLALAKHRTAKQLRTKDLERTVDKELASLYARMGDDDVDRNLFLPLIQAVTQDQSSDVQVWKAVIHILSSFSRQTAPSVIIASYYGTPRVDRSTSHQGSEQTKRLLDPVLRREFKDCTFQDVEGFYEKYFKGEWAEQSDKIFEATKDQRTAERWKDFPEPSTEPAVWEWLSNLQRRFPPQCRGIYHTTKSKAELTGTHTERQVDILLKHRSCASTGQHDWKDIRVIGEHKSSQVNSNDAFLQLARYVRDIFQAQPTRRFVHAFMLLGTRIVPFIFDRSGAYSGASFDIHLEPQQYIRVLSGYALMSDEELGLDTFIEIQDNGHFVTIDSVHGNQEKRMQIKSEHIFRAPAVVCRGTTCYVTPDKKHVVKFSWRPERTTSEAELLRCAQDRGVEGVVRLLGSKDIAKISDLRAGLSFSRKRKFRDMDGLTRPYSRSQSLTAGSQMQELSLQNSKRKSKDATKKSVKKSRSNSQPSNLSQDQQADQGSDADESRTSFNETETAEHTFHNRTFTCLAIEPAGRPLKEFKDVKELLCCFRDAIKAHQSLFNKGKILHRDISANNIIITDPQDAGGFCGTLIDMDLATYVDAGKNERSGAKHMTGTLKYMAIEIVELGYRDGRPDFEYTYRHDLESFFYVFLDICVSCGREKVQKLDPDHLRSWYTGTYLSIAYSKRAQMEQSGFEKHMLSHFSPFFRKLEGLARSLRDTLFQKGKFSLETPVMSDSLYNGMINAFDRAMNEL